jgi:CxxC-x17-CxxC domain-containing protein
MKKGNKHKRYPAPTRVEPDIAGLINKMQEQLVSLERKIDALVSQSSGRPVERKHFSEPFRRVEAAERSIEPADRGRNVRGNAEPSVARPWRGQFHRYGEEKQGNDYRERILYKAICADCNKECEVPFRPSGNRPVYCKECFSKRKRGDLFKEKSDYRPNQVVEKRKFVEKKKPNVFRLKNRKGKRA